MFTHDTYNACFGAVNVHKLAVQSYKPQVHCSFVYSLRCFLLAQNSYFTNLLTGIKSVTCLITDTADMNILIDTCYHHMVFSPINSCMHKAWGGILQFPTFLAHLFSCKIKLEWINFCPIPIRTKFFQKQGAICFLFCKSYEHDFISSKGAICAFLSPVQQIGPKI